MNLVMKSSFLPNFKGSQILLSSPICFRPHVSLPSALTLSSNRSRTSIVFYGPSDADRSSRTLAWMPSTCSCNPEGITSKSMNTKTPPLKVRYSDLQIKAIITNRTMTTTTMRKITTTRITTLTTIRITIEKTIRITTKATVRFTRKANSQIYNKNK